MSKFDIEIFYSGFDNLAVSKEKYSQKQAVEVAKREFAHVKKPHYIAMGDGYVRHRAGCNEDGEPCVGWWLEYEEHARSCPCWVFHTTPTIEENHQEDYQYFEII